MFFRHFFLKQHSKYTRHPAENTNHLFVRIWNWERINSHYTKNLGRETPLSLWFRRNQFPFRYAGKKREKQDSKRYSLPRPISLLRRKFIERLQIYGSECLSPRNVTRKLKRGVVSSRRNNLLSRTSRFSINDIPAKDTSTRPPLAKFHRSRARYTSQVIYSLSWRTRSDVQAFVRAASHYSYVYASETGGRAGRQARIGKNRPRWLFRRRKSPGRLWWIARGVLLAAGVSDSFLFSFFVSSRSFALLSFSLSLSFSVFLLLPTFFCKHRLGWSDKREHARDGRLLQ